MTAQAGLCGYEQKEEKYRMETWTPSAAIYAGSLARTYEYRTTGVPTTPQIRWSFALKPGARITCPILVLQDRVYIADSAGYLTALDAPSGDLVWSFPTDWVEDPKKTLSFESRGVSAFCLYGALGYVASARDTLYELDLHTGQVLRSWAHLDDEEDADVFFDVEQIEALFIHHGVLFLIGTSDLSGYGTYRFDRRTGVLSADPIEIDQNVCDCAPTVYRDPKSRSDLIFGYHMFNNSGDTLFGAIGLSGTHPDDPISYLWHTNGLNKDHNPHDLFRTLGYLSYCNVPLLDGTLYVFSENMWDTLPEWAGMPSVGPFIIPGLDKEFTALLALEPDTATVQSTYQSPSRSAPLQIPP